MSIQQQNNSAIANYEEINNLYSLEEEAGQDQNQPSIMNKDNKKTSSQRSIFNCKQTSPYLNKDINQLINTIKQIRDNRYEVLQYLYPQKQIFKQNLHQLSKSLRLNESLSKNSNFYVKNGVQNQSESKIQKNFDENSVQSKRIPQSEKYIMKQNFFSPNSQQNENFSVNKVINNNNNIYHLKASHNQMLDNQSNENNIQSSAVQELGCQKVDENIQKIRSCIHLPIVEEFKYLLSNKAFKSNQHLLKQNTAKGNQNHRCHYSVDVQKYQESKNQSKKGNKLNNIEEEIINMHNLQRAVVIKEKLQQNQFHSPQRQGSSGYLNHKQSLDQQSNTKKNIFKNDNFFTMRQNSLQFQNKKNNDLQGFQFRSVDHKYENIFSKKESQSNIIHTFKQDQYTFKRNAFKSNKRFSQFSRISMLLNREDFDNFYKTAHQKLIEFQGVLTIDQEEDLKVIENNKDLSKEELEKYGERFPKSFYKQRLLGKGGFALVWLGIQKSNINLKYAIKQITLDSKHQTYEREIQFGGYFFEQGKPKEQFKNMKGIENITKYYGSIESDKDIWLIYELGGKPLTKQLYNQIKLFNQAEDLKDDPIFEIKYGDFYEQLRSNPSFLKKFIINIANFIRLLTVNNICHCDIKPDNILLGDKYEKVVKKYFNDILIQDFDEQFKVQIVDFGSCYFKKDVKNIKMVTPEYTSPEILYQILKNFNMEPSNLKSKLNIFTDIDSPNYPTWAIDIWSLGCIVLEVITGIPLWMSYDVKLNTKDIPEFYENYRISHFKQGIFSQRERYFDKIIEQQYKVIENFDSYLITYPNITYFDPEILNIVKLMLKIEPSERISPEELLKMPYLNS